MAMHLAVARRRRGELTGGEEGADLVERADDWLRGQGVARPDLLAEVLAPGLGGR